MTIHEQNKWLERNSKYAEVNENVIRSVFGSVDGRSNTIYMDAETEFWPFIYPQGTSAGIDQSSVNTIVDQLKSGKRIIVTIEKDGIMREFQLAYADGASQDTNRPSGRLFYPINGDSSGYYWNAEIYTWDIK